MKSHNFPGRKNARKARALGRIERQLGGGVKTNSGRTFPMSGEDFARLDHEADTLALRIKPAEQVRAIRTKKDRSGTGRLSRGA